MAKALSTSVSFATMAEAVCGIFESLHVRFGVVIAGMAQLKAGIVPFGLRLIAAIMSNRAMEFSTRRGGGLRAVEGPQGLPCAVLWPRRVRSRDLS